MLELDECDHLLVTNPFADDDNSNYETLITLTNDALSDHHPLRTRSATPPQRCNAASIPLVTVLDSEGPGLTHLLGFKDGLPAELEEAAEGTTNVTSPAGSDAIIHPVGPNDSFAGVALRYGISIAALRRANQLWPSDPIHLRTELLIPREDTFSSRNRRNRHASMDTTVGSGGGPASGSSPDLFSSSFVAARNMILSVIPARLSLDSLSTKESASEDHELDDLPSTRVSNTDSPFAEEGHELSLFSTPHTHYERPAIPLSSQVSCSPRLDFNHIPPVSGSASQSRSISRTVSRERLPRTQPFAALPVRTSQLEPEPAMELPVRCSTFCDYSPWTAGAETSK